MRNVQLPVLLAVSLQRTSVPDLSAFDQDQTYLNNLEREIQNTLLDAPTTPSASRFSYLVNRSVFDLPLDARSAYIDYVAKPGKKIVISSAALLIGFYVAQGLTPGFVGQGGYWEYSAGFVSMALTEVVTRAYYSRPFEARSATLQYIQAAKVGFVYGCVLDAFKLAA